MTIFPTNNKVRTIILWYAFAIFLMIASLTVVVVVCSGFLRPTPFAFSSIQGRIDLQEIEFYRRFLECCKWSIYIEHPEATEGIRKEEIYITDPPRVIARSSLATVSYIYSGQKNLDPQTNPVLAFHSALLARYLPEQNWDDPLQLEKLFFRKIPRINMAKSIPDLMYDTSITLFERQSYQDFVSWLKPLLHYYKEHPEAALAVVTSWAPPTPPLLVQKNNQNTEGKVDSSLSPDQVKLRFLENENARWTYYSLFYAYCQMNPQSPQAQAVKKYRSQLRMQHVASSIAFIYADLDILDDSELKENSQLIFMLIKLVYMLEKGEITLEDLHDPLNINRHVLRESTGIRVGNAQLELHEYPAFLKNPTAYQQFTQWLIQQVQYYKKLHLYNTKCFSHPRPFILLCKRYPELYARENLYRLVAGLLYFDEMLEARKEAIEEARKRFQSGS